VYADHCTWTLDDNITILARLPCSSHETFDPRAKVESGFFHEGEGEHAIFDTQLHQNCWIALNGLEIDAVLFDPVSKFCMCCDSRPMTLFEKTFA
jgi:hypothetical protein